MEKNSLQVSAQKQRYGQFTFDVEVLALVSILFQLLGFLTRNNACSNCTVHNMCHGGMTIPAESTIFYCHQSGHLNDFITTKMFLRDCTHC